MMGIDEESSPKIVQHVLREVAAVVREKLGRAPAVKKSSDPWAFRQAQSPIHQPFRGDGLAGVFGPRVPPGGSSVRPHGWLRRELDRKIPELREVGQVFSTQE